MRFLFFILMLFSINCFSNKINNKLYVNNISSTIDCYVYFDRFGYYSIFIENQTTDDIIDICWLSNGLYKNVDNEFMLIDSTLSFKMKFIQNDNKLIAKNFLPNLKDISFYNTNNNFDDDNLYFIMPKLLSANLDSNGVTALDYGIYKCGDLFSLKVNDDSTYVYQYDDIILSTGTWCLRNNVLILFDINFKINFYLIKNDKGLLSNRLIGDYSNDGFLFKIK